MTTAANIVFCASVAGQTTFNFSSYIQLYIFNLQRLRADGILFPNLHKALPVQLTNVIFQIFKTTIPILKMKFIIIFILLLQTGFLVGQNNYTINKAIWTYTKPENYKIRVDNFSSTIKRGDSVITKNVGHSTLSSEDKILISVAKSDSIDMNVIIADYKDNSNITNFTMKGYISKLKEFLQANYDKLGSDAIINSKEVAIDGIKFFLVETKVHHKDKNYTYWTKMFIAEISGKEFSISAVFDNDTDRMKIEDSILKSKFIIH